VKKKAHTKETAACSFFSDSFLIGVVLVREAFYEHVNASVLGKHQIANKNVSSSRNQNNNTPQFFQIKSKSFAIH
jgi:hypothetical protein